MSFCGVQEGEGGGELNAATSGNVMGGPIPVEGKSASLVACLQGCTHRQTAVHMNEWPYRQS